MLNGHKVYTITKNMNCAFPLIIFENNYVALTFKVKGCEEKFVVLLLECRVLDIYKAA